MPVIVLAAFLLGDVAAAQPVTAPPAKVKKQKAPQTCEYIEVTGSRSKRRVCSDANGNLDLGPGVSNSLSGKGTSQSTSNGGAGSTLPPG